MDLFQLGISSDIVFIALRLISVLFYIVAFIMITYTIQRKPYASERKNMNTLTKKAVTKDDALDKIIK